MVRLVDSRNGQVVQSHSVPMWNRWRSDLFIHGPKASADGNLIAYQLSGLNLSYFAVTDIFYVVEVTTGRSTELSLITHDQVLQWQWVDDNTLWVAQRRQAEDLKQNTPVDIIEYIANSERNVRFDTETFFDELVA